jgi:hypothetical protein
MGTSMDTMDVLFWAGGDLEPEPLR